MDPTNRTLEDYLSEDSQVFNLWNFYLCGRYESVDATLVLMENGKWTLTSFDINGLPFNKDQGQWSYSCEEIRFVDRHGSFLFSAQINGDTLTLKDGIVLKKV